MADPNYQSYLQQVAQIRQQRRQQERQQEIQQTVEQHRQAVANRDEAARQGDWETFHEQDREAEGLENYFREINPPQPQGMDPRLQEFARKNLDFLQRYGAKAEQALAEVHNYMARPRSPLSKDPRVTGLGFKPEHFYTPQYFETMKNLMEIHGENFWGTKYTRDEEALDATEAAKISGLTPATYNRSARILYNSGRLGNQKK
jgi:hypothetical protein